MSKSKTPSTPSSPDLLPSTNHLTTSQKPSQPTILYLAYGSNLSTATFHGTRAIYPLSTTPVHVPSLTLTFDIPGFPYREPCFANVRYRTPTFSTHLAEKALSWGEDLIGVLYELTPTDYARLISSEAGGAIYTSITVPAFPIAQRSKHLSPIPNTSALKAHALISLPSTSGSISGGRLTRPNPSYAQPSLRYLNLLRSGAEEHGLPDEYKTYLNNLQAYEITTERQKQGKILFWRVWGPVLGILEGLCGRFADCEGRSPGWIVWVMGAVLKTAWGSYDLFFLRWFGDGERTVEG